MNLGPIGRLRAARWLEEHYCRVDLRWLGIFRIAFGILLCVDLIRRWGHATDFYTNEGVLPNHFSLFRPLGRDVFSIYHACSTLREVSIAFGLTLLVFLTFTLGYRTRLFHVLSLICITSLNARNLLVENGGTVVVNLLCFWSLFLPLGKRFSLDALLASLRQGSDLGALDLEPREPPPASVHAHYSLVVPALLFQWSAIYFFNVVHKSGAGWRDGSALHWFLHQDRIVTWFGIFVREHAPFWLLQGFTYATLVVEAALAVLLLIPMQQAWARRVALFFAIGLHGGIAMTSRLGPFSYVMTLFFLIPLHGKDFEWLAERIRSQRPRLVVIYDHDCGICLYICRVLRRLDLRQRLRFVANDQRSDIPSELDAALLDQTVAVVDERGRIALRVEAVSRVLDALPLYAFGLGAWLRLPGVSALAREVYVGFAERRHEISSRAGLGTCGVSKPAPAAAAALSEPAPEYLVPGLWRRPRVLVREALVVAAFVMVCVQLLLDNGWARQHLGELVKRVEQPRPLLMVMDFFRLYQGWRMFAPEPPYEDGRLVVDGRTRDGRKIDPLTGKEPDFNTDTRVGWGHSQLWCDYHLKMYFARYAANRQHLKEYLQNYHQRTGKPEDRLVAFDVWWVNDKSPPPRSLLGTPQKPIQLVTFGSVKDSGAAPWL